MQKLLDIKKMDTEYYFHMMVHIMKVNGKIIWDMERGNMLIIKDNFMMVIGKEINLQVLEFLNQLIQLLLIKGNGFKEWKMEKVLNNIMMDHLIRVNFWMERKMVMVKYNILMELIIRDNFLIIWLKVREDLLEKIINTKGHGKKEKCMEQEKVNGLMMKELLYVLILENILTVWNKALGNILIAKELPIKLIGLVVKYLRKVQLLCKEVLKEYNIDFVYLYLNNNK